MEICCACKKNIDRHNPAEQPKQTSTFETMAGAIALTLLAAGAIMGLFILYANAVREWRFAFPPPPKEYPRCSIDGETYAYPRGNLHSTEPHCETPWANCYRPAEAANSLPIPGSNIILLSTGTSTSTRTSTGYIHPSRSYSGGMYVPD